MENSTIKNAGRSTASASDDKILRTIARLDRFSRWTDSKIRIPFTTIRFGLDPLIGLIPVAGDFAGLILSLYVLFEARKIGASTSVKRKMIRNMLIEFLLGLIPILGDAFDVVFKANTRNTDLLRRHLHKQLDDQTRQPFPWKRFVGLSLLILLMIWAVYLAFY